MNRSINLVARSLGFVWVGILAFGPYPPSRLSALIFQGVMYAVAGLALVGWGLVDCDPRLARRRATSLPVLLGVLAAAMGAASVTAYDGGTSMVIFAFVAAMVAGADVSLAAALGVTAAGVLGTEISGLVFGTDYTALLGFPILIVSGLIIGRNRGAYRIAAEQAAALLAQREQLEAEQRRADLLDERARLAREIHDVLAHSLGALSIQIQAARSVLTDHDDVDRALELLAAAQRMTAEGLTETRRAVHALRADTLPLAEELAAAARTYGERYNITVGLDTGGVPRPVPADATVALLRVGQEALVNAAKHGAGKPVTIRLDFDAAGVRLTVRNEVGPGSPGSSGAVSTANVGYGLTGMRERLRMLAGTLEAGREGDDWVMTAQVPLSAQ
jgi:signal transduction histidine kinase